MFTIFGKKKIKEETASNIFINNLLDTIEKGFPEIAGIINDSPEFVACPNISENNSEKFLLIIIAANLQFIPEQFNNCQDDRMLDLIYSQLAKVFGVEKERLEGLIKDYQNYIAKVNLPSKNTVYGISKAIFGKYELNQFQDEYFKNMKSPNPMFLKRLDDAIDCFIWNWTGFKDKYQVTQ
ncbi:hypothetical protein FRY74_08445 [Vicingus serpentipes]|uniref:Uncharacterized protein n=1 Tax=Vicingus serpentipes TaxID=1926625 RepID=A0A5C6RVR4_9FLAO|nr:hypothetical protein [Vicingus serpentipes]TXB65442.1 hypothetical protein FRY74_08445 [Vicingus serpentipes]